MRQLTLIVTILSLVFLALAQPVESQESDPGALEVAKLAEYMRQAKQKGEAWTLQAIIAIALAQTNHPEAVRHLEEILEEKDMQLTPFVIWAMADMSEVALSSGASKGLMELLIKKELRRKNPLYQQKVSEILQKATGNKDFNKGKWAGWLRKDGKNFAPKPFDPGSMMESGGGGHGGTEAGKMIDDLFELNKVGLDMVFVIDATGSMAPGIAAVKNGINDLRDMIVRITPKFRIGVVIYRDHEDKMGGMENGAMIVQPLTDNHQLVESKIGGIAAVGGGDKPERAGEGLDRAINSDEMGWNQESAKAIIVIGDAPAKDQQKAIDAVKSAKGKPLGKNAGTVYSGEDVEEPYTVRPMITSCVAVPVMGNFDSETETSFEQIAKAGGGAYTKLENYKEVVKAVVSIAFSSEFKGASSDFIEWYFQFREMEILR